MAETTERPAPSATGTLAQRPLVHLLVHVRNKHLTGELEVRAPENTSSGTITFWRGRIASVRNVPPVEYFGTIAYELGRIDDATQNETLLEVATKKKLHGEVLVERGSITPEQRDAILFEQTCRKVQHLYMLPPESTFAFYESAPSPTPPTTSIDPIAPVWRGLRERPPRESVREVLATTVNAALRMANEAPVSQAGFFADELELANRLTAKPCTVAELHVGTSLSSDRVDLLVYLLLITKCAELVPASASQPPPPMFAQATGRRSLTPPPAVASKRITPPPRTSSSQYSFRVPTSSTMPPPGVMAGMPKIPVSRAPVLGPLELGAGGVMQRAQAIESEDFFAALGLVDGASEETVRAAYIAHVRVWHPDKLPLELSHVRKEVEKIFNHLTRAHEMLTDRDARRVWVAARAAKQRSKRPRNEVVDDIEKALARRDFSAAEGESRSLAEADPEDGDAQALLAWSIAQAGEAGDHALKTALSLLDSAVNRDHQCKRAYLYRATLQKRLGNVQFALRDYQRVIQLDPGNVDAQREARILEMRMRRP
ncbi:MAG: DnaJ domain-containing protein [Deltaproteobacteria bacterium]|nr:DnaJ domain-containing protein [Deltaproteobacteria bacterium]